MFNLSGIDPIILDVSLIVLLVLIAFFGVIRGIKSVLINFVLVVVSLFLGFTKYTNSIKFVIVDKLIKFEQLLPAGSTTSTKFGASMISNVVGSISVTLLLYIVLRLIVALISLILRRRNVNREKELKSKVGRVFGGLINLIYGFVIIVFALFTVNNDIFGGKALIEKSTVTDGIVSFAEKNLNKINKDLVDITVLKINMGDLTYEIDFETIDAYHYLDKKAQNLLFGKNYIDKAELPQPSEDNTGIEQSEKDRIIEIEKDRIYDLYNMSILAERFSHNNPNIKRKFLNVYDEWMIIFTRNNTWYNIKIKLGAQESGKIQEALEEAGISKEKIELFKNIVSIS